VDHETHAAVVDAHPGRGGHGDLDLRWRNLFWASSRALVIDRRGDGLDATTELALTVDLLPWRR
jgi:hypothetical protein